MVPGRRVSGWPLRRGPLKPEGLSRKIMKFSFVSDKKFFLSKTASRAHKGHSVSKKDTSEAKRDISGAKSSKNGKTAAKMALFRVKQPVRGKTDLEDLKRPLAEAPGGIAPWLSTGGIAPWLSICIRHWTG